MRKLSGLQKEILKLYKRCLVVAKDKGGATQVAYVKKEFRKHQTLEKKDYKRIEYLMRKADKQMNLLKLTTTTAVNHT